LAEYASPDPSLSKKKEQKRQTRYKDLKKDIEVLMSGTLTAVQLMRFEYQINDKLDICVRIKPSNVKEVIT